MAIDKKLQHGFSDIFLLEDAETLNCRICKLRNNPKAENPYH